MKKSKLFMPLLALLTSFPIQLLAQQNNVVRCYTVENEAIRKAQNPSTESALEFEQWINNAIQEKKTHRIIGGVYQIPVIFHVIYTNGDAVGTGTNISQAALESQIDVLNEDFRKIIGSNGYNTNPVGADCEIEFCLAKRKPDGTGFPVGKPGVNRVSASAQGWGNGPFSTTFIDNNIKPATSWDPSQYMNIWITDISNGILGYAQFPTSPLGGMGCGSQNDATDGVVFLYSSIGKSSVTGFPGPYNEGRTATHEIGHWLGLRHIWGDGGCNVDDYCNDTPEAGQANYNCPTGTNSCTATPDQGLDMIENYMDYTNDLCMNIFTQDQKMRMRTVLESSPLRRSLINSDACIPPSANDASVVNILSPMGDNCAGSITPTVVIKNRGSNNLTSATISYQIDGGTVTTFSYSGNIAPGTTDNVNLPSFSTALGIHTFTAYSTLPNGTTDPNPLYDTVAIQFSISNGYNAPFVENFDNDIFPPSIKWTVDNPGNDCYQWQGASATSIDGTFNNKTAQFPGYNNNSGNTDNFITPILILPCNASAASIQFDVAYQRRTSGSNERLYIEISEDCGTTWNATPIYDKSGTTLQTITSTYNDYFTPTTASDWRTETIDLSSFVTSSSKSIQFRFRGEGNDGNNIYVDNFKFNVTSPAEIEVHASQSLAVLDEGYYNFGLTAIGGASTETFTVVNTGSTSLTLSNPITVTGATYSLTATFGSTTVSPGDSTTFQITFSPTAGGNFSGNVSFGTNDCDEGTYNFLLEGEGDNSPPTADFTASPLNICVGSSITFTDNSTSASGWSWDFGDATATPVTSTQENPTVVYNTPGTYTVTLTATNLFGNDTETKTAYITVINGGSATLPISEGFVATTFPPTNWSITNLNSSATWYRTTDAGSTPTTGNAMLFDNESNDDHGDNDMVNLPTVNLSNYSSVQITFDVAYARYSATYSDGLQVVVESGCGATTTDIVYDKQGSTLATAPDIQGTFTPTGSQWRTETIDLSAYAGDAKVVVSFKNIAGYGNRLFIDNINLTGITASNPPIANFTVSDTAVCEGEAITFTDASTNLPLTYTWSFPGGTPSTSTNQNPSVTYNSAGVYSATLTVTNADGTDDTTFTNLITVNAIPSIISTTDGENCGQGVVALSATASGGTISWFANSSGGSALAIGTSFTTPSISSTTTYYVAVSENTCSSPSRTAVTATINTLPVIAAGTINNPSACGNFDGSIQITGSGTGDVSWTGTAVGSANGITLPYTINGLGSGSYAIVFNNGACASETLNQSINDPSAPATPTITTSGATSFCSGGSVVLTSSSATNNNWSTGETTPSITVSSSANITVTVGTTCTATSATTIVTEYATPTTPTITANGPTTFCVSDSVILSSSATSGNVWSNTATTQNVTINASGSFTVTVTDGNGCSATSASMNVTVNSVPSITSTTSDTICGVGSATLSAGASSGVIAWFSSLTGGASLNTGTSFATPTISNTTTYYAEVSENGCISPRTPITAIVATSYNMTSTQTVCYGGSFTYPDGTTENNITAQVSHFSNLMSTTSCDSIIETVVVPTQIDTTVTITANSFVVAQAGTQYQWINCKDNTPVAGATFQSFTPSDNGQYAVIVTMNGCSAQSSCHTVDHTSIKENKTHSLNLSLFPNPSSGKVALQFSRKLGQISVSVLSVNGKMILTHNYENTDKINFDLTELSAGIYFFKVQAEKTIEVLKYVKKK